MFGRRILGGQPDAFRMSLGYQVGGVADILHSPKAASPPAQVGCSSFEHPHVKTSITDGQERPIIGNQVSTPGA